jgi:exopolysaccharide biosynthesis polyprenyl glycosylphosphotransferase
MVSHIFRLRSLLRLIIYVLPCGAFLISRLVFWPGFLSSQSQPRTQSLLYLLLITTAGWIVIADQYKVASFEELFYERTGLRKALKSCTTIFLFDAGVLVLGKTTAFSRLYLVATIGILFLLVVFARAAFRVLVGTGVLAKRHVRALIVGAGSNARRAALRLRNTPLGCCTVAAYLRLPGETVRVKNAPVLEIAETDALEHLPFDEVVIAVVPQQYSHLASLIRSLEGFCKPIRTVLDFGPTVVIRERLFQMGRLQLVDLGTTPAEGITYVVVKRGFDLLFAALSILFISPVLITIAALVRLSSQGPILFRQVRVGMDGRHFPMYKFRTMRVAPASQTDKSWRSEGDPRITPVGALLRRTSLDELPQLFNVLKGDMSVVGPRPERPQFVSQFREQYQRYNVRHRIKVGITGWAQVNGLRGDTSIKKRLEYDLYYQQNWSLSLDLLILMKTIKAVLAGENAY